MNWIESDGENMNQLPFHALEVIEKVFQVQEEEITDVFTLKKGMTNRSFLFTCHNRRYIIRVAGEGTERLVNRKQEYEVYQKIISSKICDNVIYIDPEKGYKITEYLENARVCNADNHEDVQICMNRLRSFHESKLQVPHTFDIFRQICLYESLWNGKASCFSDYLLTKSHVFELKEWLDKQEKNWTLAHIDAVPDNFLFISEREVRLIDWEYAGMQDSCVDIAMFAIYAMYERKDVDFLINSYYSEGCTLQTRLKIYCYIASCGLLWSNWCEYKRQFGIEFGDYALRQYDYAKEYYNIFQEERRG